MDVTSRGGLEIVPVACIAQKKSCETITRSPLENFVLTGLSASGAWRDSGEHLPGDYSESARSSTNLGDYAVNLDLRGGGSVRNTCTADQLRKLQDTHIIAVGEFRV
jgi:hypothetical protein